jgi:hypothetical protein
MKFTRRKFIKDGVAAFTVSFAAPAFLSDLARAQGASSRNLVVLYLGGGNDALSTLVPYTDSAYYSRRPTLAVPAGNVLQVGTDSAGTPLGFHPNLPGLWQLFNEGNLAVVQRTGYQNSSRSHFKGTDIWSTANPGNPTGTGWLGRYLDALPSPIDPLAGWCTVREVPRTLRANVASVPAIPDPAAYALQSPNGGVEATYSRSTLTALASHLPPSQPHLSFVNATAQAALATLDRVGLVADYGGTVTYANDGLSQALKARHRHEGLLGADRRVRQPLGPGHEPGQRQVRGPDDDARSGRERVLRGSLEPRPDPRHGHPAVLGIRSTGVGKRQPGHRPRRGRVDDGHRRRRQRWPLRHGRIARPRQPHAREQQPGRQV